MLVEAVVISSYGVDEHTVCAALSATFVGEHLPRWDNSEMPIVAVLSDRSLTLPDLVSLCLLRPHSRHHSSADAHSTVLRQAERGPARRHRRVLKQNSTPSKMTTNSVAKCLQDSYPPLHAQLRQAISLLPRSILGPVRRPSVFVDSYRR